MPKVVCPNGHRLQIKDTHIGQVIRCPSCQATFVATPLPGESVEGAVAPPAYTPGTPDAGYYETAAPYRRPGPSLGLVFSARTFNLVIGKPLLFLGLVLVLFGRGCDAIGMRSIARTQAQYQDAQHAFTSKWEDRSQ